MVIKVFFAVLVLCTAAVVAVILAVHFRVKRHLQAGPATGPESEIAALGAVNDSRSAMEGATPASAEPISSKPSS